jgi:hypothetical protein
MALFPSAAGKYEITQEKHYRSYRHQVFRQVFHHLPIILPDVPHRLLDEPLSKPRILQI